MNRQAIQIVLTHEDQETLLLDVLALAEDYDKGPDRFRGPVWIRKSAVVELFFTDGDDEEYANTESRLVRRLAGDESTATVTSLILEVSS